MHMKLESKILSDSEQLKTKDNEKISRQYYNNIDYNSHATKTLNRYGLNVQVLH